MDSIINVLQFGLDGSHARHQALSNNIANVSTPNYKRQDVNFQEKLKENIDNLKDQNGNKSKPVRLASTNSKHNSLGIKDNSSMKFKPHNYSNTSFRNDQNNVDVDSEMAKLSKNNLYYNTLTQRVSSKFSLLQEVIQKGSG